MKIKCEYCGSMFDDTLEKCPNCGADNSNVRKSTPDSPTTIEGLKEWYASKGLPPEDITRFFIGKDIKEPRAFGIYKDENTGNFIVYKNKDNGTRAVRYEGSDEAFAVNEIHTRLKQEILQQKGRNAANKASKSDNRNASKKRTKNKKSRRRGLSSSLSSFLLIGISMTVLIIIMILERGPDVGYYNYQNALYYHYGEDENGWALYDTEINDWKKMGYSPDVIRHRKNQKDYYLSSDYNSSYGGYDFADSQVYQDYLHNFKVNVGYYSYGDSVYYHMKEADDDGWYFYNSDDDDWHSVNSDSIPSELTHADMADDFWYTPNWSSETQISDFSQTEEYQDYQEELRRKEEESSNSSSHDSDDSDYSWDSSDSWDSGGSDWDSDW
ncbi:MAG: hypothetical protein K5776_06555 [Lachnospiraceae bacterium]|nr:hypothetical protein [Lachnospiraceae bacterium]